MHGWIGEELNDYDDKYYRKWAHEIPPLVHGQRGTIIDVHHNIVPIISKASPDIALLVAEKEELLPGIFVLKAPAQLVHCAIHLFRNEEYRESFRDLCDVYLMCEKQDSAFIEEALSLAQTIGFEDELLLALKFSHEILSLDLSDTALQAINSNKACSRSWNQKIFRRVLVPQHALMDSKISSLYFSLANIRGHLLKMPLHILIYHLTVKSCRGIIEALFGAHVFTPDDPNPLLNQQAQDTKQ